MRGRCEPHTAPRARWSSAVCIRVSVQGTNYVFSYRVCRYTVFAMVMQFVPELNTSDLFRTVECQPEECLLQFTGHCDIQVHLPTFVLRPSRRFVKMSMKKKGFFRL